MKRFACLSILTSLTIYGHAQFSRYIIQLKDKNNSPYAIANPAVYLSQRALDRRSRFGIKIDSTDLPVTPAYIDSIRATSAITILNISKWLNSISIKTSDTAAISRINHFSFVNKSFPIAARKKSATGNKYAVEEPKQLANFKINGSFGDYYNYGTSAQQVNLHNGNFLHNIGLRGQNITIAVLDDGFRNYTSLHAFDSINANRQVLGVFDFVDQDGSVVEDDPHGMECFSIMAANIPGQFVGTAPLADYYLFRTEDNSSEYPIEEHNWTCGAERVDSAGGDVISSSLGYTTFDNPAFNHTYADMNGYTTMAARGAIEAARKGMIVLVAAGNDGAQAWHYISTPADADSILAVGAVNAAGMVAAFSGYGPSSDGRVKPDVASLGQGTIVETTGNVIASESGTSFATPNLAGLVSCLWEGFPELNNIQIINTIKQAGSIAKAPDNRIGYGIPDMKKALIILLKSYAGATATSMDCSVTVSWKSKDNSSMKYDVERELPGEANFTKIATINAKGGTFSNQNYRYTDSAINTPLGSIVYRIREIIDTSGQGFLADYVATASATITSGCLKGSDIRIIPNPATSTSFDIRVTSTIPLNKLQIRIFNTIGQEVYKLSTSAKVGINEIPVYIPGLVKGNYLVSIYNNSSFIGSRNLLRL